MESNPPAAPSQREQRLVLLASVLGSSMAFIDGSAVGVALPRIQRELHAGTAGAQWIVNAYLLTLGALVLVGGAAGDRFGRRRVFCIGVALFGAASVACGLAPGATALVIARGLQGLAAALLAPNSLALLGAAYTERERGRAFGAWAGFASLTSALGPPLGGWLSDAASWRAVFLINVPLALITLLVATRAIAETRDPGAGRLDWIGATLVTLGLGAVTWGLTAAPDRSFRDTAVVLALAAGLGMLAAFLRFEASSRSPMLPLELFRSQTFAGANLVTALLYFALGGTFFFLPFELIGARGYSAVQAGAALLPFSLVMGGFSRFAGRLADRTGPRLPLAIGSGIAGVGLLLLSVVPLDTPYLRGLLPALLVLAAGMTLAVGPLTSTVMGSVDPHHVGVGSGVNNAVARVAGLLAIAALGVVLSTNFRHALADFPAWDTRALLATAMAGELPRGAGLLRATFHGATSGVFAVAGACALLGGLVAFLTIERAPRA